MRKNREKKHVRKGQIGGIQNLIDRQRERKRERERQRGRNSKRERKQSRERESKTECIHFD